MEDCAIYEFPENGIKGLMNGKTGKLTGFCFLKEYFKVFIVKDRKQVRHQTIKEVIEIVEKREWSGKGLDQTDWQILESVKDHNRSLDYLKSNLQDLLT